MSVRVLIPAAGAGRRMGAGTSKQYLELAGRPVLARTLQVFEQHPLVDSITLIVPQEEILFCEKAIVAAGGFHKVTSVVAGGAERQDSVYRGLQACGATADDLILVHDGARPLLGSGVIDRIVDALRQHGACLAAVPVKDTVKEVRDGCVVNTPDRETLWLAQTPQGFRYDLIRTAHERAAEQGVRATDDAQLAEWAGATVRVVQGDYSNLKITTPEDLPVAERLLAGQKGEGV